MDVSRLSRRNLRSSLAKPVIASINYLDAARLLQLHCLTIISYIDLWKIYCFIVYDAFQGLHKYVKHLLSEIDRKLINQA